MKKTLLISAIALSIVSAYAEEYHGFSIDASQELIDNTVGTKLSAEAYRLEGKAITLQVLYQPAYTPVLVDEALSKITTPGSTLSADAQKDYAEPRDAQKSLESGLMDGMLLTSQMDNNGLAYVTVPAQYYKNGTLVDVPAEGGDIRVRFCTESNSKSRMGDGEDCRVNDITGVYVTVDAPSHVRITSDFVQANTSTAFTGGFAGTDDTLGKMQRCAIFNMPSTTATGPQDITFSGKATNSWNLFDFRRKSTNDLNGFPVRYADIVFYGVKPGERIGWTNYQTLHEGYIPRKYTSTSGIETEMADDIAVPAEYYNLQGVKVSAPSGGIFIERRGSVSRKVVFK